MQQKKGSVCVSFFVCLCIICSRFVWGVWRGQQQLPPPPWRSFEPLLPPSLLSRGLSSVFCSAAATALACPAVCPIMMHARAGLLTAASAIGECKAAGTGAGAGAGAGAEAGRGAGGERARR